MIPESGPCEAALETSEDLVALGIEGRAALLATMAAELEQDGETIVATAREESGLTEARLRGELARTAYQLRFLGEVIVEGSWLELTIDHADPDAVPAPRPDLRRINVPLGPVAVFAASNFPLAFSVPGGDTASALAAGCPVVVKAHPGHPRTSLLCHAALRRALAAHGLAEGTVGLVSGFQEGIDLVKHPAIRAVGFTGSLRGGRALHDLAAARPDPIPFYGELGSINPLIVTPEAAAQRGSRIGEELAASFTLGHGQFCTKPGLVLLPDDVDGGKVEAALTEAATKAGTTQPLLTADIQRGFTEGLAARSALPNVRTLTGGRDDVPTVLGVAAENLLADSLKLLTEECFGPLVVAVSYRGVEEILAVLDLIPGSLTASLHLGAADSLAPMLVPRLGRLAGRLVFNGYPTGVAVSWAMQHGGPYPSSTTTATSVGAAAVRRFARPVTYQDAPQELLPAPLRDHPQRSFPRRVDGQWQP